MCFLQKKRKQASYSRLDPVVPVQFHVFPYSWQPLKPEDLAILFIKRVHFVSLSDKPEGPLSNRKWVKNPNRKCLAFFINGHSHRGAFPVKGEILAKTSAAKFVFIYFQVFPWKKAKEGKCIGEFYTLSSQMGNLRDFLKPSAFSRGWSVSWNPCENMVRDKKLGESDGILDGDFTFII